MIILQALYFALPMYLANMAPVLMKWLPVLDIPMDGGKKWRGKPLLGKNKTWRGFFVAIIFAVITIYVQQYFSDGTGAVNLIDYNRPDIWLLGGLLGAGAIIGDAVKSFFKRQSGRPPGSKWFPFDQLDFVIGGLLLGSIIYFPGWPVVLIILIATPALHMLVNFIAYKIGIKNVPW